MSEMTQVLVLNSTNEDLFYCGVCKNVFNSLNLFLDHKNTDCKNGTSSKEHGMVMVNNNNNTATSARSAFISSGQQKVPDNVVGLATELSCELCKKKFKKLKTLQLHHKMHNQKPYQCPICGRCFVQNSHLHRHISSHKVWIDGLSETTAKSTEVDTLSYSCLYCDVILSNYSQFRVHLKNHPEFRRFKCIQSQCNIFYETVESLLHHVSTVHQTLRFTCHNCSKVFSTLEEIADHYQNYNNTCIQSCPQTRSFKCSQCDSVFTRAENLSLHLLTENHKKSCVYCDKIFSSDKRLRLHLQIHRKLKPYECEICSQSFPMKKYLSSHMLKHSERQFKCSVCKCLFKRPDSLQRHMKSHQLRKLYTCPFKDALNCQKEFNRSDKLKSHLKYHTKRLTTSANIQKAAQQNDAGTVEICIVPLDNKNQD